MNNIRDICTDSNPAINTCDGIRICNTAIFRCPQRIIFGSGILEKVGEEARKLGGRKVLVVTDPVIEEKSGLVGRIRESLEREGLEAEVFNGVEPEPTLKVADIVASFARRVECDSVVGVGGGSVLDMAKIASMAVSNPGKIGEFD